MYLLEAVLKVKDLRPGAFPDKSIAESVWRLETLFAEKSGEETKSCPYPYDAPLSIKPPYEDAYIYYAAAQSDVFNEDFDLYENDSALANEALRAALARMRRENRPKKTNAFKMPR